MQFTIAQFGAIIDLKSGARWSSQMLAAAVASRVGELRRAGVVRASNVVLCQPATPHFFVDLFAVWRVGACAVCVNAGVTRSEIDNIREAMRPSAMLGPTGGTDPAAIDATPGAATSRARRPADDATSLDDDALILLTSGTTGRPKGVVHTFRSLLARTALNRLVISDAALTRTLNLLPVHFGHGLIGNCLTPLLAGHDLLLAGELGIEVVSRLGELIDENGVTFMSSVPATWKVVLPLCKQPPRHPPQRVHIGSAPLSARLWTSIVEWTGAGDVVNAYGITETANWIAGASHRDCAPGDGLVGRMWGGRAGVRSGDGAITAVGHGELMLQTPTLMRGYYERPDLTESVLGDGWFRTGDVADLAADGTIRLVGRQRQEINRGGTKIYPEDVEYALERHPDVREACAFAIDDEVLGQEVGVAVAIHTGLTTSLADLRHWIAAHISPDKVPDRWFLVDAIPKTERGKVDRSAMATRCLVVNPPTVPQPIGLSALRKQPGRGGLLA